MKKQIHFKIIICKEIMNKICSGIKISVFWVAEPCSLVEVYRRFRDACCLHHQIDDCTAQHSKRRSSALSCELVLCSKQMKGQKSETQPGGHVAKQLVVQQ
jgi:hypothetical protein